MKELSIYIHIPFCISKCFYCDFISFTNKNNLIEKYIDSICLEILENINILENYIIKSIYIGGGTPSYIDSKYIVKIFDILNMYITKDTSITIEVNPNSLTESKLIDYLKCNINRVSIGLQSSDDNILKNIGRSHTYKDFLNVYNLLKKYNVNNINVDLIYPLPGLDIKILNDTLDKILALDIPHISVYNLEIHENTKLDFLLKNNFLKLPNEDIEYEMKELIENKLKKNMYNKYEISNFSKEGFESIHNLNYWNQGYYLGFGVCSSSFLNSTRYSNIDNIEDYINYYLYNDKKINIIKESSDLDDNELIKEYIILKLRLDKGVSILT
ncbi:MAG: radical SAM family heme chaperone HemW, partial [Clostridia bacterium]